MNCDKPLAYQLGFNCAKAQKKDINYEKEMVIPVNSFSHPKIQIPQYIRGWKEGRNAQL